MWDLPRSGIEPVSPALAGNFFTTGPPGSPQVFFFISSFISSVTHRLFGSTWFSPRCPVGGVASWQRWARGRVPRWCLAAPWSVVARLDERPQMDAASVHAATVRTSHLLPVSETLQEQLMGPARLLSNDCLCLRFGACAILCVSFKSGVSASCCPLALLKVSPAGLQSQVFWGLVFFEQDSWGWGAWCRAWTPLSLGRISAVVIGLFVGHLPGGMGLGYTMSLPFLIALSQFFFFFW